GTLRTRIWPMASASRIGRADTTRDYYLKVRRHRPGRDAGRCPDIIGTRMTLKSLVMAGVATTLIGCESTGTIGVIPKTTADVRVLNASTTSIDLLQDQALDPGNGDIVFGASSVCMTVDPVSHGL